MNLHFLANCDFTIFSLLANWVFLKLIQRATLFTLICISAKPCAWFRNANFNALEASRRANGERSMSPSSNSFLERSSKGEGLLVGDFITRMKVEVVWSISSVVGPPPATANGVDKLENLSSVLQHCHRCMLYGCCHWLVLCLKMGVGVGSSWNEDADIMWRTVHKI